MTFIFFNKKNGNVLRRIPTEETLVKNKFVNNLSILDNDIFYLNTYGSLYSIDNNTMKVNWFFKSQSIFKFKSKQSIYE